MGIKNTHFFIRRKTIIATNFNSQQRKPDKNNGDLVNEAIRFPEVLVIDSDGTQLGKMTRRQALDKAYEEELDLLCVAPKANPPVCKIIDYGKYRFQNQKKAKEAKKKQHVIEIKEIQLTPQIGMHDLEIKAKKAKEFFEEGNKVRVVVRFRGRQLSHTEVGEEVLQKFITIVQDYSQIEKQPVLEGRNLTVVLSAKKLK